MALLRSIVYKKKIAVGVGVGVGKWIVWKEYKLMNLEEI